MSMTLKYKIMLSIVKNECTFLSLKLTVSSIFWEGIYNDKSRHTFIKT